MKKSYLLPHDIKYANKIKNGWSADRDYNNCTLTKDNKQIKLPIATYKRLCLEGLAKA